MFKDLMSSLRLAGVTIVVCAVIYPLAILAFAALAAPESRFGSLVMNADGDVVGSRLIAQAFTRPEFFWPRPSACGYDASAAAGSNLSPANPAVRDRAIDIVKRLATAADGTVPPDMVTASGSGLDPHISLAAAQIQAARVALAHGMSDNEVRALVDTHARRVPLSHEDESRIVNVFELNLALDAASRGHRAQHNE